MARSRMLWAAGWLALCVCGLIAGEKPHRVKGEWSQLPDLPYAVQEIYPALHKGSLYVAGGLSPQVPAVQQRISSRTVIYDVALKSWREGPSLPQPRHHPYLVSTGEQLFSFGGFVMANGGRWSASRDVLLLDEAGNRWEKVAEMPAAQSETVAGYIAGKIYLAGGRRPVSFRNANWGDHGDVNALQIFDVASMTFTQGPNMPTARNSGAGAVIDGRLHVVGGRVVNGGNRTQHEVYDPTTNSWSSRAPLPKAQGGIAAALHAGRLFVFGGEFFGSGGGGVFADSWVYDPGRDTWAAITDMPVPRHGLGAVAVEEHILVVAGAAQAGGAATSNRLSAFRQGNAGKARESRQEH